MADWDGFIPQPVHCKRCQARLQGLGEGRPAESYAGTYNGLCYPCTERPAEVIGRYDDGAVLVQHPPHLPSWRRDRETFYAFADCASCRGLGVKSTMYRDGVRVPLQCPDCHARRYGAWDTYRKRQHAIRARLEDLEKEAKNVQKQIGGKWLAAWATHPIAVEYRALIKESWESPIVFEPHPALVEPLKVEERKAS